MMKVLSPGGWRVLAAVALLVSTTLVGGCSSKALPESKDPPKTSADAAPSDEEQADGASEGDSASFGANAAADLAQATKASVSSADESMPWNLGNALEPFDPPSREELENVEWVEHPVVDPDAALRAAKQEQGAPLVSAAEALKLRNDSPENNRKILGALSQLAPEDGTGVDYAAKVVRHVSGDLGSTNPLFASSVTEAEFGDLTGFSPLNFDHQLEFFASKHSLASWRSSADGMMEMIVLRDDLTWSDGQPLTAHDLEFSFKVIMTDHPLLVIPAIRQGVDQLRAVVAYDDRTLVYFHKNRSAIAYKNILFPALPKHLYEESLKEDPSMKRSRRHSELEDRPVTCGPYEFASRRKAQEFVVRRRESYYMHNGQQVRPKPHFAEVRVKVIEDLNTALLALREGDIHSMELRPEQWSTQTTDDRFYAKNTKIYDTEWTEFHFMWNQKTPYFNDPRVRWAMTYAVDYDELLNVICRGLYEQSRGNYHPSSWMFPQDGPDPVEQDLVKAEELLDEAGWIDHDGDGFRDKMIDGKLVRFEFVLMTYTTETGLQAATLMKDCLDQIGVVCHVKPTEFAAMVDATQNKKFDACMGGWGTGADPDSNENIFATDQPRNYTSYSNSEVDELFKQGRMEFDREKRAAIYGRIHNILWEDQPYTWLFYRSGFFAFNKRLRGYNFSPRGPFNYSPGFDAIYATQAVP